MALGTRLRVATCRGGRKPGIRLHNSHVLLRMVSTSSTGAMWRR